MGGILRKQGQGKKEGGRVCRERDDGPTSDAWHGIGTERTEPSAIYADNQSIIFFNHPAATMLGNQTTLFLWQRTPHLSWI